MAVIFDCEYMVNLASKEIHHLSNTHSNCHLMEIKKYRLIKEKYLQEYIEKGFNGCRYCLKEYDLG